MLTPGVQKKPWIASTKCSATLKTLELLLKKMNIHQVRRKCLACVGWPLHEHARLRTSDCIKPSHRRPLAKHLDSILQDIQWYCTLTKRPQSSGSCEQGTRSICFTGFQHMSVYMRKHCEHLYTMCVKTNICYSLSSFPNRRVTCVRHLSNSNAVVRLRT